MALSFAAVQSEAVALKALANETSVLLARINQVLEHNSDLAIDWNAGTLPAYITEDGDGNIEGFSFSRTDVGNLIGSLDQVRRLLQNQTTSQGDHLGNVSKLADPLG